jgi:hypothetical protein
MEQLNETLRLAICKELDDDGDHQTFAPLRFNSSRENLCHTPHFLDKASTQLSPGYPVISAYKRAGIF